MVKAFSGQKAVVALKAPCEGGAEIHNQKEIHVDMEEGEGDISGMLHAIVKRVGT